MKRTLDSIHTKAQADKMEDRNDTSLMVAVILFLMLGLVGAEAFSATGPLAPASMTLSGLDRDSRISWTATQSLPAGDKISFTNLMFKNLHNEQNPSQQRSVHRLDKNCVHNSQSFEIGVAPEPVTLVMMIVSAATLVVTRKQFLK